MQDVSVFQPGAVPHLMRIPFREGSLACHIRGIGPPVLLIHSVNAAASACEMAPFAEELAADRQVFSLDLPGFGASSREAAEYDVRRFVDAVLVTARRIACYAESTALDAVALSLSCEFLARAAQESPGLFRSLTFITPTGFDVAAERRSGPAGATLERRWLAMLLERTRLGPVLYQALTRPHAIRHFLRRSFGRRRIDERLVECAVRTARGEGAHHAPLAFLTGRLFSADIARVYRSLRHRIWMPHATRGSFSDFSGAGWARAAPNWVVEPFDSGALPHVEMPEFFAAAWLRQQRFTQPAAGPD